MNRTTGHFMCSLQAPSSSRPIIANTLYDIDAMDNGTLAAVDTEIESLPAALRARLVRMLELIEDVGLEELRAPHVRHLEGKMWELRVKSQAGIARGIYVTAAGRRLVLLHVFAKKSRKLPTHVLDTARKRMREVML